MFVVQIIHAQLISIRLIFEHFFILIERRNSRRFHRSDDRDTDREGLTESWHPCCRWVSSKSWTVLETGRWPNHWKCTTKASHHVSTIEPFEWERLYLTEHFFVEEDHSLDCNLLERYSLSAIPENTETNAYSQSCSNALTQRDECNAKHLIAVHLSIDLVRV